ncbi:MAG: aldose 1-epimerase family protein [Erysipelotrichaceae bacterium]|nr:aldose 1-epimerase family protein [Erysipelotrichaceae bacterium]
MKLENERYRFECTTKAAEIISLFDKKTKIEYIWSGDSKYWAGRNPILFPIIGSSFNKKYWFDQQEYTMGNHGFARNSDFTLIETTSDKVVLQLISNDVTRAQYPFDFTLTVTYQLVENTVMVSYRIVNESLKPMPFAFGLHPAFNCPLTNDRNFTDYYLEMASDCVLRGHNPKADQGLIKRIGLSYDLFSEYHTLTFNDLSSPYLSFTDGEHGVGISTVGYNCVAVWSPQAPFICLEPWHLPANKCNEDRPFIERDASYELAPKQSFLTAYTISVF